MMKFILFVLTLLTTQNLLSQELTIQGKITDSSGVKGIPNTFIMGVRVKDSTLVTYTRSNKQGEFTLNNLPIDTFKLTIGHPKFDDKSVFIFGNKTETHIQLPTIKLDSKSQELAEVLVYANNSPIFYKGDTLVFVADSFKVKENAVVEDLLKKLPGVHVDGKGKITFQGKDVDHIYVDGDEFFGADPTVATRNLGANAVQQVQVYEKKEVGESGDATKQIVNLTLKEEAKKGYFGKTSVASDGTKFYEAEILYNRFKNKNNLSSYLLLNNTPRAGFSWEDQYDYNLTETPTDNVDGIPQNLKTGTNYKIAYGKKKQNDFSISYNIDKATIISKKEAKTQYVFADSNYYDNQLTDNKNATTKHSIRSFNKIKFDSLTKIEIEPTLQFDETTYKTANSTQYLNQSFNAFRNSINSSSERNTSMQFSNTINVEKLYLTKKRESTISLTNYYKRDNELGNIQFLNINIQTDSSKQNQENNNALTNYNHSITLFHSEPLTSKTNINFEYQHSLYTSSNYKLTQDIVNQNYITNNLFTSNFSKNQIIHKGKLSFTRKSGSHSVIIGSNLRYLSIDNTNKITKEVFTQHNNVLLPYLTYSFKKKNAANFYLSYTTTSNTPSIEQMQPVLNNMNPNARTIGNLNLQPTFANTFYFNINRFNNLKGRYLFLNTNFSLTQQDIASSITYDSLGRSVTQYINVDGNQNFSSSVNYRISIPKYKLYLNSGLEVSSTKKTNFVNQLALITRQNQIKPDLGINYYTDTFSISLTSSVSLNQAIGTSSQMNGSNSNQFSTKTNYLQFTNEFFISWTIPVVGITVESSVNQLKNTGRFEGYNLNRTLIRAALSKNFLKNKNLVVSIEGNDLLNQNIQISRSVTYNQITDYTSNLIARYLLFRLTYRFKPTITKSDEEE
ncbi:MAG: TonB-dependent receptor [Crocinitomicaceae bacterium]|nr:TonB-dependent receptor [Crocinitomicaceae bacterium]